MSVSPPDQIPHTWSAEQIKEYVEAVLVEKDRALEMASEEREKAASALRVEQQRREDQATIERSVAAKNLQVELARAIKEGDERLREHIANQIMQITAALISADKLEQERIGREHDGVTALAVKLDVIRDAAKEAQDKFEATAERDKAKQNEFRAALDDLSKQMATRREMETADDGISHRMEESNRNALTAIESARQERQHQIDDLRATLAELRSRLDVGAPQIPELERWVAANTGRSQGIGLSANVIATIFGLVLTLVGLVAFAYFATH